jgi:hypothetical protein
MYSSQSPQYAIRSKSAIRNALRSPDLVRDS